MARKAIASRKRLKDAPPAAESVIEAALVDKLFPLLRDGPAVCEGLIGEPRSYSTLYRWAVHGSHGVKLKTMYSGRELLCTRRWLLDYWDALQQALGEERNYGYA